MLLSGERTRDVGICRVTAKPASWMRRIIDIFPYWQGQRPKFKLYFTALTKLTISSKYSVAIQFSNGDKTPITTVLLQKLKKGATESFTVGNIPLVYTGDSFLIVDEELPNKRPLLDAQTVYMFHTTNRSWLSLTILAGLLAGIIAALGNWLID